MSTEPKSDARQTSKIFLIREHYASLREELTWDPVRYRRLCAALGVTEYELGAVLRSSISEVERWLANRTFPKPIELHLTMIERAAYRNTDRPPLFPPCSLTSTY